MTDPVNQIKSAVTGAEDAAKTAALAEVNKQTGWAKANVKTLVIGFIIGALLGWIAHAVL